MSVYAQLLDAQAAYESLFTEPQWVDGETWKRLVRARTARVAELRAYIDEAKRRSAAA